MNYTQDDAERFTARLMSSPPVVWQVPENATIRLDTSRPLTDPMLAGAVIVGWSDANAQQGRNE